MSTPRFIVVEGNTRAACQALEALGAHASADLYCKTLERLAPGCTCEVVRPADLDAALPEGTALAQADGVAWTGSGLNAYDDRPEVTRQIELARAVFAAGVPFFGSCWALQIAALAAGGSVIANPRGREFGLARKIALSEAGRGHPLYTGKGPVFDAVAIHMDEVESLPSGATVLAGNAMSRIQAAEIVHDQGVFWGVQYHPEYDLKEIARITRRYGRALVEPGYFRDEAALAAWSADLEALGDDPARLDLRFGLGVDDDVLDPTVRLAEIANWMAHRVTPRLAQRGAA
ncbi:type 1 glutamine amidotransferase [Roseospirillum parvum]|uniref:GMP synthase (Glutamine-hydrolysing) n=1 Tax=Roseospirillum parvum TaxID=83401 RepID=A0A1G8D566_9PROT|nr:type 1 glutamine amidotransferase [Roseospirillum parvum]SDH52654.1 GMP synthase (glutamine-hydrolysing) [Roseospirillum parvum]